MMKKIKLSSMAEIISGQSPQSCFYNSERNGLPFYQGKKEFSEKYIGLPSTWTTQETKIAQRNDILMSVRAPVGPVNFATEKCCIGRGLAIIRASEKIDKEYLFYFLINYQKYISGHGGAVFDSINKEEIGNIKIPLPAMEEQKKIAARLDAVSDLLAKQKQLLAEQDTLIQSLFYDIFGTPEINEKNFITKKISELCQLNPKKPNGIPDNTECSFVPMPLVSEDGNLNPTQIRLYKDVKKGFTYFEEGDVLFAKITPCMENGKGAIAKNLKNKFGFGSTEFHVLRPLNGISNARWLFQITKFKKFRENAEKSMTGSAGQKRVPIGFFEKYVVALPPLELQEKFAAIVEQIESEKSKIKSAIAETQTLFNALMAEYFEE